MNRSALALTALLLVGADASASNPPALKPLVMIPGQPKELGAVRWLRGYNNAAGQARAANRPLLVLFDEVPGCQNCVAFGQSVLTDALLVEAAESLFTPVAIYNNIAGEDAAALDKFREPAWNNPVVRVIDPTSDKDLGARIGDSYSAAAIASSMAAALKSRGVETPGYLSLLAQTPAAGAKTERAVFAMYCFWEGESKLGGLDGVVSTSAGTVEGKECVEVEFDPARLPFRDLVKAAKRMDCLHAVYTSSEDQQATASSLAGPLARRLTLPMRVSDADTKYHLSHTRFAEIAMTPTQASRVNADIAAGNDPRRWLSPNQLKTAAVR